jgi:ribonuclease HI
MKKLIIHTDGASRGNPGEAGLGVLIEDDSGHIVRKVARYLGTATNNQAEYAALLAGLQAASQLGADELMISADSELLVKQMNGEYRVKNPELKVMFAEAKELLEKFRHVVIKYIPREKNKEADALANEAIDKRLK